MLRNKNSLEIQMKEWSQ